VYCEYSKVKENIAVTLKVGKPRLSSVNGCYALVVVIAGAVLHCCHLPLHSTVLILRTLWLLELCEVLD